MNIQNIIIQTEFQGVILNVKPDEKHEWLLSTEEVAEGYGIDVATIRQHKKRHNDELIHNTHFTSVTISHAGLKRSKTYWTKQGVIMLGFFIKSENAKIFRQWASQLILNHLEPKETSLETLKNELKQELKDEILNTQQELIHKLKQDLLQATQGLIADNNLAQREQYW